jgi:hypothetical protein
VCSKGGGHHSDRTGVDIKCQTDSKMFRFLVLHSCRQWSNLGTGLFYPLNPDNYQIPYMGVELFQHVTTTTLHTTAATTTNSTTTSTPTTRTLKDPF